VGFAAALNADFDRIRCCRVALEVVSGPRTNCFASARCAVPDGGPDRLRLQGEGGGRVLFRFGHRQGEWCITYEADDPSDIVDPNVGMCPLKLQSRLRSLEKPPRFGIAHDPLTSLLLPSRTGTYFAPEIDKCRAPDKSNGWHALRPPHVQSRESYGGDESRCNTFERNVRSISTDMVAAQMRYC
jgi:hypothetical protein